MSVSSATFDELKSKVTAAPEKPNAKASYVKFLARLQAIFNGTATAGPEFTETSPSFRRLAIRFGIQRSPT
jgi:hypothetical protein